MQVDILMVTFARDIEFAEYAMRSVVKFATGFGNRVCLVPEQDGDMYRAMAGEYGFTVKTFQERPGCGFCHHMAMICLADMWCPHADAILHIDADCMFTEPVDVSDYFIDGKPVLYREKFESFRQQHPNRYSWKRCIADATGIDAEYETMCRHPAVHWAETYKITRAAIERHTGMDATEYILSCRNGYPQGFAEFPTLGAVAIAQTPDRYEWLEQAHGNTDPLRDKSRGKMKDFWSVGGLEMKNDRHPDETARQVMDRILAR